MVCRSRTPSRSRERLIRTDRFTEFVVWMYHGEKALKQAQALEVELNAMREDFFKESACAVAE